MADDWSLWGRSFWIDSSPGMIGMTIPAAKRLKEIREAKPVSSRIAISVNAEIGFAVAILTCDVEEYLGWCGRGVVGQNSMEDQGACREVFD
ncbi:hypothetical protein ES702_02590 [subsurface metagenome]